MQGAEALLIGPVHIIPHSQGRAEKTVWQAHVLDGVFQLFQELEQHELDCDCYMIATHCGPFS